MKIGFLGTAAAEGIPAVFCNCETCDLSRRLGGKNVRTRSQILVNDDLLIDFPPDAYAHVLKYGIDFSAVKYVLFTHSHPDHCHPFEFIYRGKPYSHNATEPILKIYGNETVTALVQKLISHELKDDAKQTMNICAVSPYQTFSAGDYEITALPAAHTKGEDCLIYLIKQDGKTYLQFNDSGILPDSVYEFLARRNEKIDLVSFDCTHGFARVGTGRHMGALDNASERERMQKFGIVRDNTKYVITHFSHNCRSTHSDLTEKAATLGFIPAHDGLIIEI